MDRGPWDLTPWQAPLSIGFSRQDYWSGLPFLSPEDLPNPGIETRSPALQADSLPLSYKGCPSCLVCTKVTIHCVCVCHFLHICLLRCEGKFYSHRVPKVPGTQWMHNACLWNERKKTVKIMNGDHPQRYIWCLTDNGSNKQWRWRFLRQQILIGVGETGCPGRGCLWAAPPPWAQTLRPWPANTWLDTEPQRTGRFYLRENTESHQLLPLVLKPLPDPTFPILSVIAPASLCALGRVVSLFMSGFQVPRLWPTSLHCWLACP